MVRLQYGRRRPFFCFDNEQDFYEAYGFLCNITRHYIKFQWEYNADSGAWGNEGRVLFNKIPNCDLDYNPKPVSLSNRLTAGWGTQIAYRLNCNDYINELVNNYGFVVDPNRPGNINTRTAQGLIPPTYPQAYVPTQFLEAFNRGYNM